MGIQSLVKSTGGRAELVWFQLVYSGRFLSLMIRLLEVFQLIETCGFLK